MLYQFMRDDNLPSGTQVSDEGYKEMESFLQEHGVVVPMDTYLCLFNGINGAVGIPAASASKVNGRLVIALNVAKLYEADTEAVTELFRHELVHIDQLRSGDLVMTDDKVVWKGIDYTKSVNKLLELIETGSKRAMKLYNTLPWELEAHAK